MGSFLATTDWRDAVLAPLAGDASGRRYFRLQRGRDRAVLMDADPARGERVDRFLAVGRWLLSNRYSAPVIFAEDPVRGFLLLEDLGDGLFARLVAASPHEELGLYRGATDFLADLHRHAPPDFLPHADGKALADLVELTRKWYLPGIDAAPNLAADRIAATVMALYDRLNDTPPVVSLRDFHAENLIWLPKRTGVARIGLLDFQDAFAAHPAYDLVSLLQDARRDVSPVVEAACVTHFVNLKRLDPSRFSAIYALLGAQRALRIIGVFARLSMHFGKVQYLEFAPRVWGYLDRNLTHPALAELAVLVQKGLPEPNPERLQRIADKCASFPNP